MHKKSDSRFPWVTFFMRNQPSAKLPPLLLFLFTIVVTLVTGMEIKGAVLFEDIVPRLAAADHAVDGSPVGQATQVTVIDEDIDLELTTEMLVIVSSFFGIVFVDSIELYSTLPAPLHCFVEEMTLTDTPQDELVAIPDKHLQCVNGKGNFLTDGRVLVFNYRSVEIYCNSHFFNL